MQKAVFLDRDGVINSDVGHYYVFKPNDFVLNTGLCEAMKRLRDKGFIFIVISNQGGVSKGVYSINDVDEVHKKLVKLLNNEGLELKEIYFCPHHSKNEKCLCRKPNSLMIEKAIARFSIDKSNSFMIGDNEKDIEAAKKAGVRGIKIESNQNILTVLNKIIDD